MTQKEVRWHLVQMLPRLSLTATERRRAAAIAESYLNDKSAIVRVNALQALVELAGDDADLAEIAHQRLLDHARLGSAAEKAGEKTPTALQ